MSSYEPGQDPGKSPSQDILKPATHLTPEERTELQRLLKDPTEYPQELGSWITELVSVGGVDIPLSQIRGFTRFQGRHAAVAATGAIATSAYSDLSTGAGPVISGLSEGTFLAIFGAFLSQGTPVDREGCMRLAVNGVALGSDDTDAARGWNTSNIVRAIVLDVRGQGNNNIVRTKYRSASAGAPSVTVQNRWMLLVRVGN